MLRTAPLAAPLLYSNRRTVTALDRESGLPRWHFKAGSRVLRFLFALERVFVLDSNCVVYCLSPDDGRLLGSVAAAEASNWGAAMLAHDGCLYVATSAGVVALTQDGSVLWRHESGEKGTDGVLPGLALPGSAVQPDLKE
ncbi:MAG: PQQ-binding-like beta-propeller repeat protein [Deltaproteobacteria bacterium]|nr:PQQ-binding-like beta-propeller repeat protein [Deltaproteobacteria bacterium]